MNVGVMIALIPKDHGYTLRPVYFHHDRYCWQQLWSWGDFSMNFDHLPTESEVEAFCKNATQYNLQSTNKGLQTKPSISGSGLR